MSDLVETRLYTPEEVAAIFRHEGDVRWAYRHSFTPPPGAHPSVKPGFLAPYARRFGRRLLFDRAGIDALVEGR